MTANVGGNGRKGGRMKEEKPKAEHIHDLEDIDEMVEKMNRHFKDRCFKETINNIIKTTKGDTK